MTANPTNDEQRTRRRGEARAGCEGEEFAWVCEQKHSDVLHIGVELGTGGAGRGQVVLRTV